MSKLSVVTWAVCERDVWGIEGGWLTIRRRGCDLFIAAGRRLLVLSVER